MTIVPGTTVLLDDYKALVVKPGGKLVAEGTQISPITFKSVDSDFNWNRIALNSSSGNSLKWCLIEGGYINLSIASKNNSISNTTIRDATFRTVQGWHNQDGAGNSSAIITKSLIENSSSVGIVGQYLDMEMSHTTVRNNNQDGIYIHSGTVYPFYQNLITNNGQVVTTRDGVQVTSSGTFYMLGPSYTEGYNEI